MKINEILKENRVNEGPLDFAKKALAGVAGMGAGLAYGSPVQGAKAGWTQKGAQLKQQDLVKRVTQKAIADWGTQSANLQAASRPINAADVASWFTQYAKVAPSTNPVSLTAAGIQNWLTKEIATYMANKASAQTAPKQPDAPADQATPEKTPAQPEEDQLDWNPKTNMLSINGVQYLRTKQGWQDYNTKELIATKDAAELNTAFDTATGRAPVPQTSKTTTSATSQQSAGTQQPAASTATDGDIFAGDTQQSAEAPLPDVSQLTPADRDALRKQLKAALGQA